MKKILDYGSFVSLVKMKANFIALVKVHGELPTF